MNTKSFKNKEEFSVKVPLKTKYNLCKTNKRGIQRILEHASVNIKNIDAYMILGLILLEITHEDIILCL